MQRVRSGERDHGGERQRRGHPGAVPPLYLPDHQRSLPERQGAGRGPAEPPITGVTAGGNTVTINGTGLTTATAVHFGSATATPIVVNDGQLTVDVPAGVGPGPVSVSVTTAGGTNNGLSYTYVDAPTIGTLNPDSGGVSGGTVVTLTGTNLNTTQSVTFGGAAAPFSVISDTNLSVVSPPAPGGTPGPVDVAVTTTGGTATDAGAFTYVDGPGI
ncbi:IPT/TIG domain-containing protein [Streptomyces kronopolitis]